MANTNLHILYSVCTALLILVPKGIRSSEVKWALVKVPVTDLSSQRLIYNEDIPYAYYNNFPYSSDKGSFSCLRAHQLKFNELVKILTCLEHEVECEVHHFFCRNAIQEDCKTFWASKEDFLFLDDLPSKSLENHIPAPYLIGECTYQSNKNVLTLTKAWFDEEKKQNLSVGTRFVRNPEKDTADSYAVFSIDVDLGVSRVNFIPRLSALVDYPQDSSQATKLFVQLLKEWAANDDGSIPYVLGGCSHTGIRTAQNFSLTSLIYEEKPVSFWQREPVQPGPYSGFDCSGLILCAAQLCGIPYFYKNTATVSRCMEPLKDDEKLQEGDILWNQGHVMVVSDIEKNLLIEAVGYGVGFGEVHEISVDKAFKGISDFSELVRASKEGMPLERLSSVGCPFSKIEALKIFPLSGLWDNLRH